MKTYRGLPHQVCLAAALLAVALEDAAAASLRATPSAKTPTIPSNVADLIAKAAAADDAKKEAAKAPAKPVVHKKLDFGFTDFEKKLTEDIAAKLQKTAQGAAWNDDLRAKFIKNATQSLKESLDVNLKPLKQSIGKTWMALPKDEQKDSYVDMLKKSFVDVFAKSLETFSSHFELSEKRIKDYSQDKSLKAEELLAKSEHSIEDSLITEHCYEVDAKKKMKSMKKPANATEVQADKKKFCIQSVVGNLVHRLNDTQGLISMSMRFDAGAMSLAQKKHKGVPGQSTEPVKR